MTILTGNIPKSHCTTLQHNCNTVPTIYVHTYVRTYPNVYMYIHTYIYVYVNLHVCLYGHLHIYVFINFFKILIILRSLLIVATPHLYLHSNPRACVYDMYGVATIRRLLEIRARGGEAHYVCDMSH